MKHFYTENNSLNKGGGVSNNNSDNQESGDIDCAPHIHSNNNPAAAGLIDSDQCSRNTCVSEGSFRAHKSQFKTFVLCFVGVLLCYYGCYFSIMHLMSAKEAWYSFKLAAICSILISHIFVSETIISTVSAFVSLSALLSIFMTTEGGFFPFITILILVSFFILSRAVKCWKCCETNSKTCDATNNTYNYQSLHGNGVSRVENTTNSHRTSNVAKYQRQNKSSINTGLIRANSHAKSENKDNVKK